MDERTLIAELPDLVRHHWGREPEVVEPTGGPVGMGSATATITVADGDRYVAKWVPGRAAGALDSGCAIARRLAESGLETGAPLSTVDGDLTVSALDGALSLLRFVDGEPLTGESAEQQELMAVMLARVHQNEVGRRRAAFLPEVFAIAHDAEPWVRPAVEAVRIEHERLPELTWGILHTDPAPEAFLQNGSADTVGLIDWTGATHGPLLYDVASALMYLGGPANAGAFQASYLESLPAMEAEIAEHLQAFRRFRGAIQAAYFSDRIRRADLIGIESQAENWKGLHDARRMLAATGLAAAQH